MDDLYAEDEGVSRGGFGPPHTYTKYLNGPGVDNKLRLTSETDGFITDDKYFLADHLGSTNGLTNVSGTVTEQTGYDSFGNPTAGLSTRYQFTGRERDDLTGLQYSRARWYDPNLGRFISEDPIGFRGGNVNLYGYVWNNPENLVDPAGRQGIGYGEMSQADREYYRRHGSSSSAYDDLVRPALNYFNRPERPECGPAGHPFREWLVPDSVGGPWGPFGDKYDLIPPCAAHDSCYSSCNATKAQCDTNLGSDVRDTCLRGGGSPRECSFYGGAYYQGVHRLGNDAYQSAQEEAACIACVLPIPPDPCSSYGNWSCK